MKHVSLAIGFLPEFPTALGAVEKICVGGWVVQISCVMSKGEEREFGEGVTTLMDGTEEEKGRRLEEYQKPF